jgi:hypothetical protein
MQPRVERVEGAITTSLQSAMRQLAKSDTETHFDRVVEVVKGQDMV